MAWLGVPTLSVPATVSYAGKNRLRHFRYLRDNLLLIRVHAWLLLRCSAVWLRLLWHRYTGAGSFDAALHRG